MAPYIFMERNGIHIIDLYKTMAKVDEAAAAMKQIAKARIIPVTDGVSADGSDDEIGGVNRFAAFEGEHSVSTCAKQREQEPAYRGEDFFHRLDVD